MSHDELRRAAEAVERLKWATILAPHQEHADALRALLQTLRAAPGEAGGEGGGGASDIAARSALAKRVFLALGGDPESVESGNSVYQAIKGEIMADLFQPHPTPAPAVDAVKEREAFEEWAKASTRFEFLSFSRYSIDSAPYHDDDVETAWEAWKARAAAGKGVGGA